MGSKKGMKQPKIVLFLALVPLYIAFTFVSAWLDKNVLKLIFPFEYYLTQSGFEMLAFGLGILGGHMVTKVRWL